MSTPYFFERMTQPDGYAHALAHMYQSGFRLYDPSLAASRDPQTEKAMMIWPPFATAFQIRHHAIAGRKWGITPAEDSGEEGKLLARITHRLLKHIDGFTQARLNLARADVSGARYAERVRRTITATYGDGKPRQWVVPVQLRDMPKENFRWQPRSDRDRPYAALQYARKSNAAVTWVDVPAWAPLMRHVIGDSEEMLGYGRGLRDALFFLHNAATRVFEAEVQAAERFGHGWVVMSLKADAKGKPTISNTQLVDKTIAQLEKQKAKHVFVKGEGDTLEMLAPPGQGAQFMHQVFEELIRMGDRLIMGGTLPSGGGDKGAGSFARSETEADTMSGIFDTLSDMLEESHTRDLVVPTLQDNVQNLIELGLHEVEHPSFDIMRGRKQDPGTIAEWLEKLTRSGLKVKADQVYDLVDLEKPGEGDDVLEAMAGTDSMFPPMPDAPLPRADAPARTGEDVSETALNGAQVTALQGLAEAVAEKRMDMEAAALIAASAFPKIPPQRVRRIFQAAHRSEAPPEPATSPERN